LPDKGVEPFGGHAEFLAVLTCPPEGQTLVKPEPTSLIPKHSIGYCPICGGGLCGVRICGVDSPHGLVVCDECDATWLEPDLQTAHQYPDVEDPRCPVCNQALWDGPGHWASWHEIESLGWEPAVDRRLDADTDEGLC